MEEKIKKNIAISTLVDNKNFGNRLQNFALQKFLTDNFNVNVKTIKYNPYYLDTRGKFYRLARKLYRFYNSLKRGEKNFKRFNKNINFDTNDYTKNIGKNINRKYDYVVVGSDQVWNDEISPNMITHLLPFVDNNKKIAYSASNAKEQLSEQEIALFKKYLNDFNSISVREKNTVKLLQPLTTNHVQCLVDPTFLLDKEDWIAVSSKPKNFTKKPFLLTCILGNTSNEYSQKIKNISKKYKLKIISVYKNKNYGPAEFLWLIQHAKLIMTDSFHCIVFSMIYEKPFIYFPRIDTLKDMSSRILNLENLFETKFLNINDTNIENNQSIFKFKVENVKTILEKERKKSIQFFNNAFSKKITTNNLNDFHIDCSGCGLCAQICPTKAISYLPDENGFIKPQIDESKCIHCGKCKNNCSNLANFNSIDFNEKEIFAIKQDIKTEDNSSSTGIATLFATQIIKNNGIVYGVKYQKDKNEFYRCETVDDLENIKGSKYFQCNITTSYKNIENDLKNNKQVLVFATPCQIAGLKSYFKNYDNLFLVSLICHGVPSFELFQKYCLETFGEMPENVNFRYKYPSWQNYSVKYKFQKDEKIISKNDDIYKKLFLENKSLNDCCYNCNYAGKDYGTDIVIGDCRGIEKINKKFCNNSPISIVAPISNKGTELFKQIQNKVSTYKIPPEDYKYCNVNLFYNFNFYSQQKYGIEFYYKIKTQKIKDSYKVLQNKNNKLNLIQRIIRKIVNTKK